MLCVCALSLLLYQDVSFSVSFLPCLLRLVTWWVVSVVNKLQLHQLVCLLCCWCCATKAVLMPLQSPSCPHFHLLLYSQTETIYIKNTHSHAFESWFPNHGLVLCRSCWSSCKRWTCCWPKRHRRTSRTVCCRWSTELWKPLQYRSRYRCSLLTWKVTK